MAAAPSAASTRAATAPQPEPTTGRTTIHPGLGDDGGGGHLPGRSGGCGAPRRRRDRRPLLHQCPTFACGGTGARPDDFGQRVPGSGVAGIPAPVPTPEVAESLGCSTTIHTTKKKSRPVLASELGVRRLFLERNCNLGVSSKVITHVFLTGIWYSTWRLFLPLLGFFLGICLAFYRGPNPLPLAKRIPSGPCSLNHITETEA